VAVVFDTVPGEKRLQHLEQLTGIIRDFSWKFGEQKRSGNNSLLAPDDFDPVIPESALIQPVGRPGDRLR